jgi:hypothetical protein
MLAESSDARDRAGAALQAAVRIVTDATEEGLGPICREWLTRVAIHPGLPAPKILERAGRHELVEAGV